MGICTIFIVGTGLTYIANRSLQENVIRLQKKNADNLSSHISSFITQAINDLRMVDMLEITESASIPAQKEILDNLIIYTESLYSQIVLIDTAGNEKLRVSRYHTYLRDELINVSNTELFTTASRGDIYISPIFISPESGLISLRVAIKIKKRVSFNIISSEINITKLWQEISKIRIGATGYAYIVDSRGKYIASQSPTDVLQHYGIDVSKLPPVQAFISRKPESGLSLLSYRGFADKSVMGVFSPVKNTDWAVIVELPVMEAYEGVIRMLMYLAAFILLGSAAAGFTGFIVSKKIVRHMNELSAAALNIGKGDLEVNIPGQHLEDEVGVLARTMSSMQTELKESYKNLQIQLSELKAAQKALSDSERTVKAIFDNVYQLIGLMNTEGILLDANRSALNFINLKKEDVIGKPFWAGAWWRHSEELQQALKENISRAARGEFIRFEATHMDSENKLHFIDFSIKPVFDDENKVIMLIPEGRDVTERKEAEQEKIKLEENLRQAQKMESIASLAGGIAHDFNNVLGGIVGTVSLIKYNFEKKSEIDRKFMANMISVIETSAGRAKDIVKQLLTLSRKQDYQLIPVDLNNSVENVVKLCNNSFDKSIEIRCHYFDSPAMVNADPSQIEQVILNICINSAHAMTIMRKKNEHSGGILSIDISRITADRHFYDSHPDASYNRYLLLSINDTGIGMSREIISKVFDPFFTTKDKENGTGLGLSMVYNIIHEHKGFIDLYSEPGKGTTFNIYLPYLEEGQYQQPSSEKDTIFTGEGLILIIDDEDVMRNVASVILDECGYDVLLAENGAEGIKLLQETERQIDLILLDMAMPGMSGKETYTELKKIRPGIKVILSSGFKHDIRVVESMKLGVNSFIQKPYTIYNLSKAVFEILHEDRI